MRQLAEITTWLHPSRQPSSLDPPEASVRLLPDAFRRMDLMSLSTTLAGPPMLKSSVETELLKDSPLEVLDHLAEMTPFRRLGRPEDIAAAV